MPKHREGHAPLVSVHSGAVHGGAHLPPEHPPRRAGWLLAALAIGLTAVVAAMLVGVLAVTSSPDTSTDQSSAPLPGPEESPSTEDLESLAQCRAAWHAVQEVLAVAEPSMEQWEVHIAAMNKLVAGEITLAQASAFWERTRVDARRHYDAFASSDGRLDGPICAVAGDSSPEAETLSTCARAVTAAVSTLDAARTTLARWSRHINDMNRMRNGTLSPAMAQHMWLRTWREGAPELRVYHQRERVSSTQQCKA